MPPVTRSASLCRPSPSSPFHPSPSPGRADSRTCVPRGTTGPKKTVFIERVADAAAQVFTPRVWVGKLSRRSGSCDPSYPNPGTTLSPPSLGTEKLLAQDLEGVACAEFDSEAPSRSCVESPTSDRFLWPHWREWRSKVRTVKLARLPVGSKLVWQHALSSCEIAHHAGAGRRIADKGSSKCPQGRSRAPACQRPGVRFLGAEAAPAGRFEPP